MIKQNIILELSDEGSKIYTKNGKPHRLNGPATIYADGPEVYYINGKWHRLNGPALIWPDGLQYYCVHGERISEEYFYENYYQEK